jgi:transposase
MIAEGRLCAKSQVYRVAGRFQDRLTVVMDPDSGAVVLVGDGKGAEPLHPSWKRLRPSGARIEAVAMDMSADRRAVSTHLPKAAIVFDHFHVIKLFNDKLSDLRRAPYREATA